MAYWYVSPAGNPGNTGAIGSPWDFGSAIDKNQHPEVVPGDTFWLRGGTYAKIGSTWNYSRNGIASPGGPFDISNSIKYRGYRSNLNDVSTLEKAILQETSNSLPVSAGAITVNGVNGVGATVSLNKVTNAQAVLIGHQILIASGPAAGVYVITANANLIVGNTVVSIVPNLRGVTAGGEAVTLTLGVTGEDMLVPINGCNYVVFMDLDMGGVLALRTFESGGPTAWSSYQRITTGLKLINCTVHDFSGGTFTERTSGDQEIYGNLFYNQGFATGDGGGHHIYIHHNNSSDKRLNVEANCMFNDEGVAMQMYDSLGASGAEQNIDFLSNICFNAGQLNNIPNLGGIDAQMFVVGGPQEVSAINFRYNYGYQPSGKGDIFIQIGQPGQLIGVGVQILDNYGYVAGRGNGCIWMPATIDGPGGGLLTLKSNTFRVTASDATHNGKVYNLAENGKVAKPSGYDWGPNTIYRNLGVGGQDCGDENPGGQPFAYRNAVGICRTLAQFLTECGFTGDVRTVDPTATLVFLVKADKYDPGRAWLGYYNYHNDNPIVVSPSLISAILGVGDTYMIHDVRNVWAGIGGQPGAPVIGPVVWGGAAINLPNTQLADPVMTGSQWGIGNETAPPATAPFFNVFLLRRTAVGSSPPSGIKALRPRGLRR